MSKLDFSTRGCLTTAFTFGLAVSAAFAQGVPHLSVTPNSFRTLVPNNVPITAAMCQPGNSFCLNTLVGGASNIVNHPGAYATDVNGNSYVFDDLTFAITKFSPSGTPTIIAGQTPQTGFGGVPLVTSRAVDLVFNQVTSMAADLAGNLYVVDTLEQIQGGPLTEVGSIIKIDPLGVATRLTGVPGPPAPAQYASLASNQALTPAYLALDQVGDIYFTEIGITSPNPCMVKQISAGYGIVKAIAGTGTCATSYVAPAPGQLATTYALDNVSRPLAVGVDGTAYFISFNQLMSVTTDGVIHLLTPATPGNLGNPTGAVAVDAAGNVYLGTADSTYTFTGIIEVTKGGASSPSQVLTLTGFQDNTAASDGNADGLPATAASVTYQYPGFGFQNLLSLDAAGRLLVLPRSADYVAALDRNGSVVFDRTTGTAQQQTITLTNSGSGTLVGQNVGATGLPFSLSSPISPFDVDQSSGTCLAKFATPGSNFTLVSGESCTLVLDYTPSVAPQAEAFTFYSNDPLGPLTISISSASVTNGLCQNCASQLPISTPKLALAASSSASGSLSAHVTVLSSITNGTNETKTTPTGQIALTYTNNVTGTQQVVNGFLSGTGDATLSASGVPAGTYSVQASYPGDGTSAPSFSPVQTFYSTGGSQSNVTAFASNPRHFFYNGASAQLLNFSSQFATNPAPAQFQDLLSGNNVVQSNVFDSSNNPVDTTSATSLPVGWYTVKPVLPNASALNYNVTANPRTFQLTKAPVTVKNTSFQVSYGQALSATLSDAGHFTLANNIQVISAPPILQSEIGSGLVTLATNTAGIPVDASGFVPTGRYPLTATLTGPGAGNYDLQSFGATLNVAGADITLAGPYISANRNRALNFANLCRVCYTAPNPNLLLNDPNMKVGFHIKSGTVTYTVVYPFSDFFLPAGTYTVEPFITGPGAANYGATIYNGIIRLQ